VKVRRASGDDAAVIAGIHVRSWQAAYRDVLPDELLDGLSVSERETSWLALLSGSEDRQLTLVAERDGGDLLGSCSVAIPAGTRKPRKARRRSARSTSIPATGARGWAAMLAAALRRLGEKGWREVILWVLPENRAAVAFYDRFGFEVEEGVKKREERSGRPVIRLRAVLTGGSR
jgi:RimJ/RimL family protein N-acetyltransferase